MACPLSSHLGPFSVADGRPKVIVELGVVTAFVAPRRDGHHRGQRPIDAAEIGGIVGEWLTHTPTMSVLERSRFDADSLD
jgi:hypothetical protein